MAIYGSLGDLPAPEILNMLARRTGVLRLETGTERRQRTTYDLHLRENHLIGLFVGGRETTDPMLVTDVFRSLLDLTEGNFEFNTRTADELRGSVRLPLTQLILSSATVIDELGAYRARFSHPTIIFQMVAPVEEHLPGDLELFWFRAEHHLRTGISAEALAAELSLSVEQVQLHFYKLRAAGTIAPWRSHLQKQQESQAQEKRPLLQRLLRSLRKFARSPR